MITGYAVNTSGVKLFGRVRSAGEHIAVEETALTTPGALHALVSQGILSEIREGPEQVATRGEIDGIKAELGEIKRLVEKLAAKAKVLD